jgi:hypothetical protein
VAYKSVRLTRSVFASYASYLANFAVNTCGEVKILTAEAAKVATLPRVGVTDYAGNIETMTRA